jgi:hypothetical protein
MMSLFSTLPYWTAQKFTYRVDEYANANRIG